MIMTPKITKLVESTLWCCVTVCVLSWKEDDCIFCFIVHWFTRLMLRRFSLPCYTWEYYFAWKYIVFSVHIPSEKEKCLNEDSPPSSNRWSDVCAFPSWFSLGSIFLFYSMSFSGKLLSITQLMCSFFFFKKLDIDQAGRRRWRRREAVASCSPPMLSSHPPCS